MCVLKSPTHIRTASMKEYVNKIDIRIDGHLPSVFGKSFRYYKLWRRSIFDISHPIKSNILISGICTTFTSFIHLFTLSYLFSSFLSSFGKIGTKKMEYKTRQWHEKCFSCCVCKTPIGTKSFIPREQEIYCAGCYEEKYATRCIKCSKVNLNVCWKIAFEHI